MHWPTLLKNLLRIAATVGVVVAIAAAFLVLHPAGDRDGLEVNSSRADIAWMTPFEATHTQKFASALEDLGHEPPRAYDLNGNNVYFSTRTTRKSPERLVQEYQQKFVEHGVNSKVWLQTDAALARLDINEPLRKELLKRAQAAVNGEILPTRVDDAYMSMTGMLIQTPQEDEDPDKTVLKTLQRAEQAVETMASAYEQCDGDPKLLDAARRTTGASSTAKSLGEAVEKRSSCDGGATTCTEWKWRIEQAQAKLQTYRAAIERQPKMRTCPALGSAVFGEAKNFRREFTERLHGYRSVEAFRDQKSGQTVVTASWSDEEFDMTKMLPSEYGVASQEEHNIPLCKSCTRSYNFTGSASESPYESSHMYSELSVDRAAGDYVETLAERGWEFRDATPLLQQLYYRMDMPVAGMRFLRFARGDDHLTLQIRPDRKHGRTAITALSSN